MISGPIPAQSPGVIPMRSFLLLVLMLVNVFLIEIRSIDHEQD
jgi:hypothetical protein